MLLLPLPTFSYGDRVYNTLKGHDLIGVVSGYEGHAVYLVRWGNSGMTREWHACYLQRTIVQEIIDAFATTTPV